MFRFTIRDVLWLTVVVGLGLSWWLQNRVTEYVCARNYDAVEIHSEELRNSLQQAKFNQGLLEDLIVRLQKRVGGSEQEAREALVKWNTVDWSILDKPMPRY